MNHDIMPVMLERKVIYESDWVALYSDKVKMPDGRIFNIINCIILMNQ